MWVKECRTGSEAERSDRVRVEEQSTTVDVVSVCLWHSTWTRSLRSLRFVKNKRQEVQPPAEDATFKRWIMPWLSCVRDVGDNSKPSASLSGVQIASPRASWESRYRCACL